MIEMWIEIDGQCWPVSTTHQLSQAQAELARRGIHSARVQHADGSRGDWVRARLPDDEEAT